MSVEILDLQLIFGVDGARRKFEKLAAKLIRGEFPGARAVRPKNGDDGVDIYVGDWNDPIGIDVYQCKWFPQGLGEPQKGQIRRSFQRCIRSKKLKAKRWVLCVPVDLSPDEIVWFEQWRASQSSTGVVIENVWGAERLEGLLYEKKNEGIKESFFKQEHLTQIRELHSFLPKLVAGIEMRLHADFGEREQSRKNERLARQAEYVGQFFQSMKREYNALTRRPRLSPSNIQQLGKAGRPDLAKAYQDAHKRLGHWEVVIWPSQFSEDAKAASLAECQGIVQAAKILTKLWEYPQCSGKRQTGIDWVGMICFSQPLTECWRISQRGVFGHLFPILSDAQHAGTPHLDFDFLIRGGVVPPRVLNIDEVICVVTHVLRFARNLTRQSSDNDDMSIDVTVGLTATKDRLLVLYNMGFPTECGRASEPQLVNTWRFQRRELEVSADALAATVALWFYERFNWQYVNAEKVVQLQSRTLQGC
jgi:hypothetical protein